MDPLAFFVEPFAYDFMQRALGMSLLVAAVCAVLSCYLVLKGWSLMGDAISHAVLPGIVIAFVIGIPLAVGAFLAGLACALLTGYLKYNSRVKEDTVMGIVFSGMFGFGLVLFTKVETDQHLNHILFGNVLGVTAGDLIETAIIAGGTLLVVLAKRRDLLLYCFDPNHAQNSRNSSRGEIHSDSARRPPNPGWENEAFQEASLLSRQAGKYSHHTHRAFWPL